MDILRFMNSLGVISSEMEKNERPDFKDNDSAEVLSKMPQFIDKSAVVAEINWLDKCFHISKSAEGQKFIKCLLAFLEEPYDDVSIKVAAERDIKTGIQTHAQMYSLWTQSELFKQLTREQQRLYAKEIEQACISGGFNGVKLAKDPRCKESLEGKEE